MLGLWVLTFGIGTASHLADLIGGGPDVYAWAPAPLELFYLSLVVLDALVVGLLLRLRREGVLLGAVVMALDVPANWWVTLERGSSVLVLLPLTVIGILVVTTAPWLDRVLRP